MIKKMAQEEVKRRGLLKKHAAVDYEVWQWKSELERSRPTRRVTKTEVQAYAIQAYKEAGITFKASNGWYRRWRVRWTQLGIIKPKDSKGKESFTNKIEFNQETESVCETDDKNIETPALKKHNNQTTTKLGGSFKKSSSKIDDKIVQFDKNTENKEDCSNIPNKCQTSSVHKIPPSSSVSSEINKDVEVTQLQCKEAEFSLLKDNTDPNLTDATLLESTKTGPSNPKSSVNDNVDSKQIELDSETFTLQNVRGNSSESIDNMQVNDCDHNLSKGLEKHSEAQVDHSHTIKANPVLSECINSESVVGPQCSSGISPPSTNVGFETFKTNAPLLDNTGLEFGDHESFCDFCEDFHPRQKTFDLYCCKQREGSSFLRSVFEKEDSTAIADTPPSDSNKDKSAKTINESVDDKKFKNPSVLLPKGKRYLIQFKSKVVNYALNHNALKAAAVFKVNRNTISEWLNERRRSSSCAASKTKIKSLPLQDDKEFLSWLESSKFNLTNELIKQKASEWLQMEGAAQSTCEWMRMYAHRLNGTEDGSIKKRYITYPEDFKRMVVFHAQTHSNMAAGRVFGVSRRRVMVWQKVYSDAKVKKASSASNVTDEAVDKQVFEWFSSQDPPPASKQVRQKGRELYKAAGYSSIQCSANWYYRWRARYKLPPARNSPHNIVALLSWVLTQLDNNQSVTHLELAQAYNSITNSKVSRGWTFHFCKKYYKLLQSIPDPSVALPLPLERQVKSFLKTLHETVHTAGYKDTEIILMDEVPLQFLPQDHTKKPPLLRRSGFEACQASLIVSSRADGTLLPTMFVFKGVAPSSGSDPCVVPVVNDSGLVSEDTVAQWVSTVCITQLQGQRGLLITDCFDAHTAEGVQKLLAAHKVHHAVIPGGCGFKLMAITKVCQLFKSMLEDMCEVSVTSQMSALSPPSPDQFYHWSVRVHKHLVKYQKENIKTALKDMKILP